MLRAIGLLTVVGLLIVVLGAGFGWFSFSAENEGDRKTLNFEVNKAEAQQDAKDARDKLEDWTDDVKNKIDGNDRPDPDRDATVFSAQETVEGTLVDIDVRQSVLSVDTDEGAVLLQLDEECDVFIDSHDAEATDLRTGDHLLVAIDKDQEPDVALRIVARRGA